MTMSDDVVQEAWDTFEEEHNRWFSRRKMDKSGYELIRRKDDDPISSANLEIKATWGNSYHEGMEFYFKKVRGLAAMKAALESSK